MDIIISNQSTSPIYEQISEQIKALIISGALKEGDALPSMRLLAKELRISVITTKRAYEELEKQGFLFSVTGKGSFVAGANIEFIREEHLRSTETHIGQAVKSALLCDLSLTELQELVKIIYEEQTS